MFMFKPFILFTLFLVQGVFGFCVYNQLTDGSSFTVEQKKSRSHFKKELEMGTLACCDHTNTDCFHRQKTNDKAKFLVDLHFASGKYSPLKLAICTIDGELVIYGTEKDHFAKCIYANGVTIPIPLMNA